MARFYGPRNRSRAHLDGIHGGFTQPATPGYYAGTAINSAYSTQQSSISAGIVSVLASKGVYGINLQLARRSTRRRLRRWQTAFDSHSSCARTSCIAPQQRTRSLLVGRSNL